MNKLKFAFKEALRMTVIAWSGLGASVGVQLASKVEATWKTYTFWGCTAILMPLIFLAVMVVVAYKKGDK